VLQAFGLSTGEQELYGLLLSRAPVDLARLRDLASDRPWVDGVPTMLTSLEELGLVARHPGAEPRYLVVSPDAAFDTLLAAQHRALDEARQWVRQLASRFDQAVPSPDPIDQVEIVYGREAMQRRWVEIQRSADREICGFDAPPYNANPATLNDIEIELLRRGVTYRTLYDRRALDQPGRLADLEYSLAAGELARVGDVPMKLVLSDAPGALVPLHREPGDLDAMFVVHDSVLLEALRALFDMCWERAIPLGVQQSPPPAAGEPSELERKLLPLLAAGMTDRAIAAHLGRHERTIRIYVKQMMAKLDSSTRLQAGYQAIRRGWLRELKVDADDRR